MQCLLLIDETKAYKYDINLFLQYLMHYVVCKVIVLPHPPLPSF